MNRRTLLASAAALTGAIVVSRSAAGGVLPVVNRTHWKVRASEGFDAIAFLGPLSGGALYRDYYAADADAFLPKLPKPVQRDIAALWRSAQADGFGLLGPNLQVLFSTDGNDASLDALLVALRAKEQLILPRYRQSRYWNESDWSWFTRAAPRIDAIFTAMKVADFTTFRAARTRDLGVRIAEVQRALDGFDVIHWQEKLSGRIFDPTIEVVLLQFSKPHGIKVQGQTFLQSIDYDTATTVRIAAHEMLHPPFDEKGPAAQAAVDVLGRDPLVSHIVHDHNPQWGYTTLIGMLNEDLVQALDQLISEVLGVGRNPADRWRKADDGMHVIAAGIYGLLRDDHWIELGGSIEPWLQNAAKTGRLKAANFHQVAARVLERPVDHLWPLA